MSGLGPGGQCIYLWGFSGSGKTTLGKKLANKIGYRFIDLDQLIEKEAGMSVEAIFKDSGEKMFRDLEKSMLHKITEEGTVVATGGGTPCFFDNAEWMNSRGLTIWLRAHQNTILKRVSESRQVRPLLHNLGKSETVEKIEKLLQLRQTFYALAKVEVDAEDLKVKTLLDNINRYLQNS